MPLTIGDRLIGGDASPFVIAEAGVNHNGDTDVALALIDAAARAGADAVKFQSFDAEAITVADAPQAAYQQERAGASTQREMLAALELPVAALPALQARAQAHGLLFLSTPFDLDSLRILVDLGVPALKIGSGDLTNLLMLRAAAATGLPLLLSTGMATLEEVGRALQELPDVDVALLHCTSAYPAPVADANLRAIGTLRDAYGREVGYSDHTIGVAAAIAATGLGASIIEKHLTLDRGMEGPDHAASAEPATFAELVRGVREAHAALGDGIKRPRPSEEDARRVARRSLVTTRELPAGHRLVADDLTAKRPGTGISPFDLDAVVGSVVRRQLGADHLLRHDDLSLADD